jgi:hypothetical protein
MPIPARRPPTIAQKRHACTYNTNMVLDGGEGGQHKLPVPAHVPAFAPLAHKPALARLRISKESIQADVQLSAA